MKCKDCEYFKIEYEPYKSGGVCWDMGLARCIKHDLVTDFITHKKFAKLECVEGAERRLDESCTSQHLKQ